LTISNDLLQKFYNNNLDDVETR